MHPCQEVKGVKSNMVGPKRLPVRCRDPRQRAHLIRAFGPVNDHCSPGLLDASGAWQGSVSAHQDCVPGSAAIRASTPGQQAACRRVWSAILSGRMLLIMPMRVIAAPVLAGPVTPGS
jgi:hypothetical protein